MEENKIDEILSKVDSSIPFASGNSRKCYNIDGFAVLQEKADEKTYQRSLGFQKSSQFFVGKGVNTPEIHSVNFKDGRLTLIEDFASGSPVYYRDARSYCLERGLKIPKNFSKIDNELKDIFMKEEGIEISDFFKFSKEEKILFRDELELFKSQQKLENPQYREDYQYSLQIDEEVKQENLNKARTYAGTNQKFYDKFLQDIITVCSVDRGIDCHSDNYLFDENKGFSLIDLNVSIEEGKEPENLSPDLVALATGYASDILTRGSEEEDVTKQIVGKVVNSAYSYGLNNEDNLFSYFPQKLSGFKEDLLPSLNEEECQ